MTSTQQELTQTLCFPTNNLATGGSQVHTQCTRTPAQMPAKGTVRTLADHKRSGKSLFSFPGGQRGLGGPEREILPYEHPAYAGDSGNSGRWWQRATAGGLTWTHSLPHSRGPRHSKVWPAAPLLLQLPGTLSSRGGPGSWAWRKPSMPSGSSTRDQWQLQRHQVNQAD